MTHELELPMGAGQDIDQLPSERGPSVTAAVVAATLLLLRNDPDLGHLVDPNALAPLERAVRKVVPAMGGLLDHIPWPLLRRAALGVERIVSPGFVAHYALRKSVIRAELRRAFEEGHRQVVLLGAGFDMLSTCLPTEARVFEVDHPATQAAKKQALGSSSPGRHGFVSADLAVEDLRDALLRAPGFDPARDTVYVAEGLLMYLTPARVAALLCDLDGRGQHRTRVVMTVITPDRDGAYRLHTQRRVVDACMRGLDEPFVWGTSRESLPALLAFYGLCPARITSTFELKDSHFPERARRRLPRPTGELVVVADGLGAPAGRRVEMTHLPLDERKP
jgi:methyltransferase (TIGR00027 family)